MFIRRTAVYFLLFLVTASAVSDYQTFETPDSVATIEIVEVLENVYVLHGLNGLPNLKNKGMIANLGFIVGDKGVIIIDSGSSNSQAELLLDKIMSVTHKKVIAVFNTHIHGDHWLGNQAVRERFPDAKFYAHPTFIKLAESGAGDDWVNIFSQLTNTDSSTTTPHIPTHSIEDTDKLSFGSVFVKVIHNSKAHTTTDVVLAIEQDNGSQVVFLGDTGFFQQLGRMDDGSFKGNIALLKQAISLHADVYVPGHGPTTTGPLAAQAYLDYLELLYKRTLIFYKAGITDYEIKAKILPEFSRWQLWDGFKEAFGRHINLVYLEIEEASF